MSTKKKILIIEDDGLIINFVSYLLDKEGFDIRVAKDGNEGLKAVNEIKPDLIIMDIILPYKSGLEITISAKKQFPNVPILIVSSLGLVDDTIQEALNLGVSAVIAKPFSADELIKQVKLHLTD